jgi:hypothetical protein
LTMSKLERFVNEHRAEFDSDEPESGHSERFAALLDSQVVVSGPPRRVFGTLKIAAVILVLISFSVLIFETATRSIREWFSAQAVRTELPVEIRDAVKYYDDRANAQIAAIHQLSLNRDDAAVISASALKEIRLLDAGTEELKKSLTVNPGNENLLDAIVRNQQMKDNMLENIITQLSHSMKQTKQIP